MKVNYDFYSGKDEYSDGDIENEIIKYEEEFENLDNVFEKDIRWPVFYHLTPIRENILNWYPFKENSCVLEIGAGMGAITSILCKKCKSVTSVELSKNRAKSIETRNKDKENLEIIVGNLNNIDFRDKKFDYITLIGVFEYASLYTNTDNPYIDFLNNIKKLLKDDGKILMAIENKFGMKYFLGAPEDHTNIKYDGIVGYKNKKGVQTFGKEELKQILKQCGFEYLNFYYPLPDYKLPELIFSDKYLPTVESINNYIPYYYEGTQTEFDEIKAYQEVIKNNNFDFFANSFFVECSKITLDEQVEVKKENLVKINENSKKFYDKDYSKKDYELEIKGLKDKVNVLETHITEIEGSRVWKLTKPLRNLRNKLK